MLDTQTMIIIGVVVAVIVIFFIYKKEENFGPNNSILTENIIMQPGGESLLNYDLNYLQSQGKSGVQLNVKCNPSPTPQKCPTCQVCPNQDGNGFNLGPVHFNPNQDGNGFNLGPVHFNPNQDGN